MRIGLALPQYPFSVPAGTPFGFDTVVAHARRAVDAGFDSVWLSDHLTWDVGKYGGSPIPEEGLDPLVTLAALAACIDGVRVGTLVLCEALRPPAVLAKALATLDRVSNGRLEVGLGAGWYPPDYDAIGMEMPSPGERLDRLAETLAIVVPMLTGEPATLVGRFHRASGARARPDPVQRPRPPVFVGGSGDRLLALVASAADGWNTCWRWTTEAYDQRVAVLDHACERIGRDPASVSRSLGLYALCGEDEHDLAARFARLRTTAPAGVLDRVTLDEWRTGRLVGTVEQVREQVAGWTGRGVESIIVCPGGVPFHVGALDDVDALGEALRG